MDAKAMEPFGKALLDYFKGDCEAAMIFRRDDGIESLVPVSHFFRGPGDFTIIENSALEQCRGRILDVGAGSGLFSLALQQRGLRVTAIDIDPRAVKVMTERGVENSRVADFFGFSEGKFDTLLLMGHGLGLVENIAGLKRFFGHAAELLRIGGQVLFDSLDVRCTRDPNNLAYHEANRRAGKYIGEIRLQIEYRGKSSPYFGWLQADAETVSEHASRAGWRCEVIKQSEGGDYLARLTIV
ncbi:MAG: methyltransferase domain-containing protein [Candidatus Saccharicenans sp.]